MRRPAVVVALAAALLAVTSAAHAQSPDLVFDAQPVKGSSNDPSGGWFSLSLAPGASAEQALAVHNTSSEPLELVLTAVDATTMAAGGASYAAPDAPAELTATWIELASPRVRLRPDETRTVPFVVHVPDGAAPGDHLAGISVAAPSTAGDSTTLANGTTTSIDLRTRRVLAVHVTTPGPAEARVAVRGVEAALRPPGPQLEIALENTGQRLTRGRGVVTLPDDDVRLEFDLDTFVPGTSIAYPLPWPGGLAAGRHPVRVELEHDGRKVAWEGEVSVTGDTVKAAREIATEAATPALPASPSGMSSLTLGLAVLGGVLVAGVGQAVLRVARRRPV